MSNEILNVIEEREVLGFDFKIYGDFDNPLFLAKDVATWIGHSNTSKMLKTIDEEEKVKKICEVTNSYSTSKARNTQEMLFLTEDGLYEVLMQSRKPIAKEFKKQVKMILRELRKGNIQLTPTISKKDLAALDIINSKTDLEQALAIKKFEEIVTVPLLETIEKQQPKVDYCDDVLNSEGSMTTTQIAQDYGMSARKLNSILNDLGIQYKNNGQWILYSKYKDKGYINSNTIMLDNGKTIVQTKWTQKGREFIYNVLRENGYSSIN